MAKTYLLIGKLTGRKMSKTDFMVGKLINWSTKVETVSCSTNVRNVGKVIS